MANEGRALLDRIVYYFGRNQRSFGVGLSVDHGVKELAIRGAPDLPAALLALVDAGYLTGAPGLTNIRTRIQAEPTPLILTAAGWDRFERLKHSNLASTQAFMAMKFNDRQMDHIYAEHFKPAVSRAGLNLETVVASPGLIDVQIELQIVASRVVIADLTHGNQGVYYEAGFAKGIGRSVIYACRLDAFGATQTKPHFDVDHHYCLKWTDPVTADQMEELTTVVQRALLNEDLRARVA